MGDVIPIGGSGIKIDNFHQELVNPETRERVANSIASICGFGSYELNNSGVLTHIRFNSPNNDVLSHVRTEFNKLLVSVPASFPSQLVDNLGIEPDLAIQLASDFSLAYGQYSFTKPKRGFRPQSFVSSQVNEVWDNRYLSTESRIFIPPYRFAGTVALQSSRILGVPANELRNQPPHIAGILNPLSKTEARSLHGLLRT